MESVRYQRPWTQLDAPQITGRNSEWHLFDINGVAGVITGGTANVLSNNLYDRFGVEMYASGSAATQWRFLGRFVEEEGLVAGAGGGGDVLVGRGLALKPKHPPKKKHNPCADTPYVDKTTGKKYPTHLCNTLPEAAACRAHCKPGNGLPVLCCCANLPGGKLVGVQARCVGVKGGGDDT